MKIRIRGNSLRIRVSRSELTKLAGEGLLEEQISFGENVLVYSLQTIPGNGQLTADFVGSKITMYVPAALIKGWTENEVVGFESTMALGDTGSLYLLLEKDFACIGEIVEDQSDKFENPNKTC